MNKRDLKRCINGICRGLYAECLEIALYHDKKREDLDNLDSLRLSIIDIHNDFIRRVSHVEPGMEPSEYYNNLTAQFEQQVNEIIDQINNL